MYERSSSVQWKKPSRGGTLLEIPGTSFGMCAQLKSRLSMSRDARNSAEPGGGPPSVLSSVGGRSGDA